MQEIKRVILIVDDEESIRDVLSRKLESDGYNCEVAADGKEALWKAFMKDFDIVLMDIKMPGLSGMEVLPQMVTNHPDTCVIMMTAVVDTETAVKAMKLGAYDYVTKPFDLDDLGVRIKRALERRRLILENKEYQIRLEQRVKEQTEQIQQYYREAVGALSREQIALEELQSMRILKQGEDMPSTRVDNKSHESSSSVKEFAKKLSLLFGGAASDSSIEQGGAACVETDAGDKEPQGQATLGQKEGNLALYKGTVELAILPPVRLQQMLQMHEHIRPIPNIKVLNLGGSVEKGITIRLVLEATTPLLKILRTFPEVEKASDESEEAADVVPRRRVENPPVRRIIVRLCKKTNTEVAGASLS